jgi:hypothetical protein
MNQYARGAVSGSVATLVMTAVMQAGKRVFRFRTPAPKEITKNVVERAGLSRVAPKPAGPMSWVTAHEMYGVACGVIYVLVRPFLPSSRCPSGLVFGGAVWGVSYLGYLPALDLYPSPDDDSRSRLTVMVIAHAVFGVVLAEVEHRLSQREGHRQAQAHHRA